ncbi:MAG: hypothetical protein ACOC5L_02940, partial [Halobacteriota archaeon]
VGRQVGEVSVYLKGLGWLKRIGDRSTEEDFHPNLKIWWNLNSQGNDVEYGDKSQDGHQI